MPGEDPTLAPGHHDVRGQHQVRDHVGGAEAGGRARHRHRHVPQVAAVRVQQRSLPRLRRRPRHSRAGGGGGGGPGPGDRQAGQQGAVQPRHVCLLLSLSQVKNWVDNYSNLSVHCVCDCLHLSIIFS